MATRKRKRAWNEGKAAEMFPELHGGKLPEVKPGPENVSPGHSTSDFASRPKAEPPKPKGDK